MIRKVAKKIGMVRKGGSGITTGGIGTCAEVREQRKLVWEYLKKFMRGNGQEERETARDKFIEAKRELRKLKKEKERQFWEEKWEKVAGCKDVEDTWKAIKPFRAKRLNLGRHVNSGEWLAHFKELLGEDVVEVGTMERAEKDEEEEEGDENSVGTENREIERDEMLKALKNMKRGEAAVADGIAAEFLKGLPEEGLRELRDILNEFWEKGEIGRGWEVGRIFPIFKAGDASVAANYRGITLMNTGYKLLTSIITGRVRGR